MKKKKLIIITSLLLIVILTALVVSINYDRIKEYYENRTWELADSIGTYENDETIETLGGNQLIQIKQNEIKLYNHSLQKNIKQETLTKSILTDSENDYYIIAEQDGTKIVLYKNETKVWENKVNGAIQNISVNKNGYAAITYSQSGYKSLVRVIKVNGEELFTSYLASTYAIDAEISNDNKLLAIAEVDAEGIKIKSNVKIIHIDKLESQIVNTIELAKNTLIVNIEFNDKNEVIIQKDNGIEKINDEEKLTEIINYTYSEVALSTIENKNYPVIIRKVATGIFDSECVLEVYGQEKIKTYELKTKPRSIHSMGKTIALDMGTQVLFIGINGKLIKRSEIKEQIKEIILYDNGKLAALIFRNKIEIVKI